MADVFLSYARPSLNDAMHIADCLRAAGYSVWYDESLPAHRAYTDVISEQLDAASAVLVLWSHEAAASQWVRSEANRARETGRLVQLRLDDARLPMPFDQIQCADFRRWSGDCSTAAWKTVAASVAALTGGDRPFAPTAPPSDHGRRSLLLAGGATAVLGVGGFALWRERKPSISPEAALLLQKGMDALQANDALDPEDEGSTAQAISLLTDGTRLAPEAADGWGGLALAYAARRRSAPVAERPGLAGRGRAAAETALRLDPTEPRSLGARRIMSAARWLRTRKSRSGCSLCPPCSVMSAAGAKRPTCRTGSIARNSFFRERSEKRSSIFGRRASCKQPTGRSRLQSNAGPSNARSGGRKSLIYCTAAAPPMRFPSSPMPRTVRSTCRLNWSEPQRRPPRR